MAELGPSSFVLIDLDPDSGDPSGLTIGTAGDTIISSILPENIREVVTRVEDSSATWDESGGSALPADVSGRWEGAYETLTPFSGNVETSVVTLDASTHALDTFSGSVETSTANLDASTQALNVFSGSVETSTANLDALVPSATGFSDWDRTTAYIAAASGQITEVSSYVGHASASVDSLSATDKATSATAGATSATAAVTSGIVDAGATNWNLIYGDRPSIQSISGTVGTSATAYITGSNPTATVSAITVSACPVPAPWTYVRQTNNAQSTADQTDFYFGGNSPGSTGTSPATTAYELSPELITWVSASFPEHILVRATGYYEVIFNGSFYLPAGATNPTTITQELQTSALSSETTRISKVIQMRNNAEPTDAGLHWIGRLGAGDKIGIQITADATTNLRRGSTLTCKRIN
jgi:hypothetical protein